MAGTSSLSNSSARRRTCPSKSIAAATCSPIVPPSLQALLSSRGVSVASAALEGYLQWISANYESEMKKGNYLPNIAYDADGQFFSLM